MAMNPARRILSEISRSGSARVDLGQAALLIAQEDYPDLQILPYIRRLDELARHVSAATSGLDEDAAVESLVGRLFGAEGFRGNADHYDDPRNSYLNEVLDRKLGLPITLAVVAIEVARRLGLPLAGVGLPGHFALRHARRDGILFDPFRMGRRLTLEDCREIALRASGRVFPLRPEHLRAATNLEILVRILRNLKGAHLKAGDLPRALSAVERIMILDPTDRSELRERGLILAKMGLASKALVDLETYLRLDPDAHDSDEVWEQVRAIRQARSLLD